MPAPLGYAQLPRNYTNQPPPPPGYNVGWQYTDPNAPQSARTNLAGVASSTMAPTQRTLFAEVSKGKRADEYLAYQYQTGVEEPSHVEEHTVPVLLCHTCSICREMRSAGYHRTHPVIPGKPVITTPCRKCKRRSKNSHRSRTASYTKIRTCTIEEPCDWPRKPIEIGFDNSECRGRRRSRDGIHASRKTDHLRSRIIKEGSSRANIGLRTLQRSPPRGYRSMTRVRVSSLSPGRSQYDGVWPPLDVVRTEPSRPDEPYPVSDEMWPPPDVVRTHSYRKKSPTRPSPRIVELSSSPPPARSRVTRVSHREESEERRPRSPVRRSESRIRIQSHLRPYRTVLPDHRVFSQSDETSTNDAGSDPVNRGILKSADMTYETSHRRRTSMRDSQQSTNVEIDGPRVQFASKRREEPRPSEGLDNEQYERYPRYESDRYVDEPASPPIDRLERLHIRRSSPSPQKTYDEICIDRARRISHSPPRRYEEVRFRHVSVSPPPPRERTLRPPPSPPPPERSVHSGYRHISRANLMERLRSLTPPPNRKQTSSDDDMTDSEEDEHGPLTEVRSWKGIDENGQPTTFVEDKRKIRMIDQGSVGGSEFRPLTERLTARSWREV